MKKSDLQRVEKFIRPYRVTKGKDFRLKDHDPSDTGRLTSEDKDEAKQVLSEGVEWMAEQQDMLYAQDHWALLLVFQAMDAALKFPFLSLTARLLKENESGGRISI